MIKRPTIIDVAKLAGVSKSTVSLVLQNSPSVKRETREKVQKAMRETGYVYNRGAANLRGANAGLIGLVINNLRNPYYTELGVSAQMALSQRGYAAVVGNSNEDPQIQANVIESMLEHGVDALLIAPSYGGDGSDFEAVLKAGLPAMQVLRQSETHGDSIPFCSMDYRGGSLEAAQYLAANNARELAFVGGIKDASITIERCSGLVTVAAQQGLPLHNFYGDTSRRFGYETALKLAREYPNVNAAVAFNDLVAIGMIAGFAEAGVTLGSDFRLIGFDDIEEAAQSFPRLSTVRCDVNAFGKWTAGLLLDWLEKGVHPGTPERKPVELILRATA
ncbi:LacI family DNA-binding transcriptional regulator [Cognatishimia sp. WU-CL00825]|uniref:LacI family DNA-binding transcriptional regulator n=1 Tax=Cognatishimia sp. WU-CL00825 TaxID=3127658 RepID=UPI00310300A9